MGLGKRQSWPRTWFRDSWQKRKYMRHKQFKIWKLTCSQFQTWTPRQKKRVKREHTHTNKTRTWTTYNSTRTRPKLLNTYYLPSQPQHIRRHTICCLASTLPTKSKSCDSTTQRHTTRRSHTKQPSEWPLTWIIKVHNFYSRSNLSSEWPIIWIIKVCNCYSRYNLHRFSINWLAIVWSFCSKGIQVQVMRIWDSINFTSNWLRSLDMMIQGWKGLVITYLLADCSILFYTTTIFCRYDIHGW